MLTGTVYSCNLISDKKNKNLILTDSMIDIVEYTRSLWAATVSFCAYNGYMTVSFSCYGAGKLPFTYVLRILGVSRLRRCRRNHLRHRIGRSHPNNQRQLRRCASIQRTFRATRKRRPRFPSPSPCSWDSCGRLTINQPGVRPLKA